MTIRATAAALLLCFPVAAFAGDPPAPAPATGAAATPPKVEVVRQGGVAQAWRADGGSFASFGPDGDATAPTAAAQVQRALSNATDVRFLVIDPGEGPDPRPPCRADECIGDLPVLGDVPVQDGDQHAIARDLLAGWLADTGEVTSKCPPMYHHGLAFSDAGHQWRVLLCYSCGHIAVLRDGVQVLATESRTPAGQARFDALLHAADRPYFDVRKREWVPPKPPR